MAHGGGGLAPYLVSEVCAEGSHKENTFYESVHSEPSVPTIPIIGSPRSLDRYGVARRGQPAIPSGRPSLIVHCKLQN